MKIQFSKMHGCGNDFVLIDGRRTPDLPWKTLAPRLLDRRFGIGGDQLLVLLPSRKSDVRMAIYEQDSRESEMCGNGIRCAARFLHERGEGGHGISFETLGGTKAAEIEAPDRIRIDMGKPVFEPIWGKEVEVRGRKLRLYALSMGNPHAVLFMNSIGDLGMIEEFGPILERHSLFPNGVNVEFVFVRDERNLAVRIWERGAGETFACGTGASASAVVSFREGKAKSPAKVHFKGGTLEIGWKPGESVFMTGPATCVFSGEIEI